MTGPVGDENSSADRLLNGSRRILKHRHFLLMKIAQF